MILVKIHWKWHKFNLFEHDSIQANEITQIILSSIGVATRKGKKKKKKKNVRENTAERFSRNRLVENPVSAGDVCIFHLLRTPYPTFILFAFPWRLSSYPASPLYCLCIDTALVFIFDLILVFVFCRPPLSSPLLPASKLQLQELLSNSNY